MGNCWPKPIESLPASATPRPASPVHNKDAKANKSRNGGKPSPANDREEAVPPAGRIITRNLKIFTLAELKSATRNFRPDTVLGEGGFGRVFKGYIDEKTYAPSKIGVGMPVAVKKSNPESEQGPKEWQAELKFLGKFSHPNLVKLLGYCSDERQLLLVYEYMPKGSLEGHLFRRGGAGDSLPWDTRIKIAIGAARGLAFLHNTEKQVIYRDFKASNILLDQEFNAKLSDFGLAKLGPIDGHSHVTTNPVGTYGYAAPEYMATGHLYVKSDVYGFGIVLLEIITGLRVLDNNRPTRQTNLVNWAMPFLNDKKRLNKVTDQRLMGHYPLKAVFATAELILHCLKADPKCRPSMDEVLSKLVEIGSFQMKPNESQAQSRQYPQHTSGHHRHSHLHQPLHHSHDGIGGARGKGAGHPQQKSLRASQSR